jgi:hypothetical protein
MDSSIILRKTKKGVTELKTREHQLSSGLRMMLILVDGKSDIDGLHKKVPYLEEMEEYLSTLLKEGFIDPGNDDTTVITEIMDTDAESTRAKWEIVEMVAEVLGAEFADRATRRFMHIPESPDDLKQALHECCQFIALTIDESKAGVVEDKGADILSRIKVPQG